MSRLLRIDGAYGEGGGQILRTALSLAALCRQPIEIVDIRAGRPRPGLAAQHLSAVRAAAQICGAAVDGNTLGSSVVRFAPRTRVQAGDYVFDIAEAREGGSAGSVVLVLHTVLLPLAMAAGRSSIVVRGGTHVPWSPSADYACDVWLPALSVMGVTAEAELRDWGWHPSGKGEMRVRIEGRCGAALQPITCRQRGALRKLWGRAVVANLPMSIARRLSDRASDLLRAAGVEPEIRVEEVRAASPGAGIFLAAEYAGSRAGFAAIGRRGRSAEDVAEEAAREFIDFHRSSAALDAHLADQLLLPASLAAGESSYTVQRVTRHLTTNCRVLEAFGAARTTMGRTPDGVEFVTISPTGQAR